MNFAQRMKIVGYILGGLILLSLIVSPFTKNTNSGQLTDAQRLAITDDCIQNPKALRCS